MAGEVKEYVSVNEKEFWGKKTLELTVNWRVLDSNLQKIVDTKVAELNAKIDSKYDVWLMDFNWKESVSSWEAQKLTAQLKEVIKWFNAEIARIEQEYIWRTKDNQWEIRTEISQYFSDKSIFVEKWKWLAALGGYAKMDRGDASPVREKELPLN